MSRDCCCDEKKPSLDNICPGCEKPAVDIQTVKSMVTFPLWELEPNDEFFYEDAPDSPTVYFSTRSGTLIDEKDIREKVYSKHSDEDDCYVCYCFQITVGALRNATSSEREAILRRVKEASGKGQCSCKTRNPKGSCCIGDIKALIDKFNRLEQ